MSNTVRLVSVTRGSETVVGVRSTRTDLALYACSGSGPDGAAKALVAAWTWCRQCGLVVVGEDGRRVETSRAA